MEARNLLTNWININCSNRPYTEKLGFRQCQALVPGSRWDSLRNLNYASTALTLYAQTVRQHAACILIGRVLDGKFIKSSKGPDSNLVTTNALVTGFIGSTSLIPQPTTWFWTTLSTSILTTFQLKIKLNVILRSSTWTSLMKFPRHNFVSNIFVYQPSFISTPW
jgi:hypothetical protein